MSKGITPLWDNKMVEKMFYRWQDRAEEKMLQILQRAGEEFVKIARQNAPSNSFYDHTGNLRSSIGYVIVRDGKVVGYSFGKSNKGTDGSEGVNKGFQVAKGIALSYRKGLVLIGVAGMEYALHVESIEGKDVISSATEKTEDWLRSYSAKLYSKL